MSEPVLDAVREGFARSDRVFWLDGGGARDWSGRRSLVGVLGEDDVSLTFDAALGEVTRHAAGHSEVVGDDVFAVLEQEIARDAGDSDVHWVGCFGYGSRPDLGARPWGIGPDAVWMRSRDVQFFSHEPSRFEPARRAVGRASSEQRAEAPDWYRTAFAEVQEQLRAGNSYEVNLTYRDRVEAGDPLATYLRLRASNPAPYAGLLSHRGTHLLSSSPERYATVEHADSGDRWLETKPIKGTTARGETPEHDEERARELATDPKYRAENLMIVDLLRNDLSMVCEVGSVTVPSLMAVESYASVHQLVSTVRGRLRGDVTHDGGVACAVPRRLDDRRSEAAHDAGHRPGRGVSAGALRRCVRLDLRRRTGRPRRRDPLARRRGGRHLVDRHGWWDHRALRGGRRVGRDALEGRTAAVRVCRS